MSTMSTTTSSNNKPPQHCQKHIRTHPLNPSKMLTDFSIDTLIGQQQRRHHQAKLHDNDNDDVLVEETEIETETESEVEVEVNDENPEEQTKLKATTTTESCQRKYRPKNFRCPACKMAFSNNGQLKNHVRIHTGERPFRCTYQDCNKTFTRNEELTRHKLIHTGVRPHACTVCGKRFGRKDHLKKHVRTHDRKRIRRKVYSASQVETFRHHLRDADHVIFSPPKTRQATHEAMSGVCLIPQLSATNDTNTNIRTATAATNHLVTTMSTIPKNLSPVRVSAPTTLLQPPPPPITFSSPSSHPLISIAGISHIPTAPTIPTTTTTTLQQITTDYWAKWYNFLGFYHHQQHHHHHHQQPQSNAQFYHNQNLSDVQTSSHNHLLRKR